MTERIEASVDFDTRAAEEALARTTKQLEAMGVEAGEAGDLVERFGVQAVETAAQTNRLGQATTQGARGFQLVSDESKRLGGQLSPMVSALGQMSASMALATSESGSLAAGLAGTAAQAAAGFGAFGPLGGVIGAITGAMPHLVRALDDTDESAERAADEMESFGRALTNAERAAISVTDAIDQMVETANRVREARDRQDELNSGLANADALQSNLQRSISRRLDAQARLIDAIRDEESALKNLALAQVVYWQNEERIARAQLESAVQLEAATRAKENEARVIRKTMAELAEEARARGAAGSAASRQAAEIERLNRVREQELEQLMRGDPNRDVQAIAAQISLEGQQQQQQLAALEKEIASMEALKQLEQERADAAAQAQIAEEAIAKRKQQNMEREAADLQEEIKRREKRAEMSTQLLLDLQSSAVELIQIAQIEDKKARQAAIDGWLKQTAIQETINAGIAFAFAMGNVVANPPLAATKAAEGAYHAALAVAAGGASLAIPNAPNAAAATGGGNTTNNTSNTSYVFNAPIPREDVGAYQRAADRADRRRNGRRV